MLVPRFDPRADALAQFGQGLGSGVGGILSRFMEAKNFQKQTEGITPETPLNELMQKLAYTSPELQQQYLSPATQQRMVNQGAYQDLKKVMEDPRAGPQDWLKSYLKAAVLSGNHGAIGDIMNRLQTPGGYEGAGNIAFGGQPMGDSVSSGNQNQPVKPITGMPAGQPTGGPAQQPMQRGATQSQATATPSGLPAGIEKRPYTPEEKWGMITQAQKMGPAAVAATKEIIADRETEYNVQKDLLDRGERQDQIFTVRSEQMAKNPNWRPELAELARVLPNVDPSVKGGTPEQTFDNIKRQYLNPILDGISEFNKSIPSQNVLARFDNPNKQKTLRSINSDARKFIEKFPEQMKRVGYDIARTELRNRTGIGPVSAEYAIQYPDSTMLKEIKALPPAKTERRKGHPYALDVKNTADVQEKVQDLIAKWVPAGESPLVIKDLIVDGLGYPDYVYDDAIRMLVENGMKVPDYNERSYKDSLQVMDPRNRGLLDVFGGRTSLGPMEFFK